MNIKPGVHLQGIRPEIVVALTIADRVYADHESPLVITSGVEGKHMRNSLHYVGAAVDIRLPESEAKYMAGVLSYALGEQYDVVLESTHIHIEFQPETGVE